MGPGIVEDFGHGLEPAQIRVLLLCRFLSKGSTSSDMCGWGEADIGSDRFCWSWRTGGHLYSN